MEKQLVRNFTSLNSCYYIKIFCKIKFRLDMLLFCHNICFALPSGQIQTFFFREIFSIFRVVPSLVHSTCLIKRSREIQRYNLSSPTVESSLQNTEYNLIYLSYIAADYTLGPPGGQSCFPGLPQVSIRIDSTPFPLSPSSTSSSLALYP